VCDNYCESVTREEKEEEDLDLESTHSYINFFVSKRIGNKGMFIKS
jgi:hypothetical protein